jgi:hypothetical protein
MKERVCECCGQPLPDPKCNIPSCDLIAEWEGWHRKLDPATRQPTGLLARASVCDSHKYVLVGAQKGGVENQKHRPGRKLRVFQPNLL